MTPKDKIVSMRDLHTRAERLRVNLTFEAVPMSTPMGGPTDAGAPWTVRGAGMMDLGAMTPLEAEALADRLTAALEPIIEREESNLLDGLVSLVTK